MSAPHPPTQRWFTYSQLRNYVNYLTFYLFTISAQGKAHRDDSGATYYCIWVNPVVFEHPDPAIGPSRQKPPRELATLIIPIFDTFPAVYKLEYYSRSTRLVVNIQITPSWLFKPFRSSPSKPQTSPVSASVRSGGVVVASSSPTPSTSTSSTPTLSTPSISEALPFIPGPSTSLNLTRASEELASHTPQPMVIKNQSTPLHSNFSRAVDSEHSQNAAALSLGHHPLQAPRPTPPNPSVPFPRYQIVINGHPGMFAPLSSNQLLRLRCQVPHLRWFVNFKARTDLSEHPGRASKANESSSAVKSRVCAAKITPCAADSITLKFATARAKHSLDFWTAWQARGMAKSLVGLHVSRFEFHSDGLSETPTWIRTRATFTGSGMTAFRVLLRRVRLNVIDNGSGVNSLDYGVPRSSKPSRRVPPLDTTYGVSRPLQIPSRLTIKRVRPRSQFQPIGNSAPHFPEHKVQRFHPIWTLMAMRICSCEAFIPRTVFES
ncbi:hypothetical protein BDZ89DRAFT_1042566 [Hymenopellis radicata]|nr:hypothetical protein BDZ89DRAFT_1042566 [Hymenopellis radicata]